METQTESVNKWRQTYCTMLEVCFQELFRDAGSSIGEASRDAIIEYLDSTDFFTALASTKYHEAYPGGLCKHSCEVCQLALSLNDLPKFKHTGMNQGDIMLAALAHDWCKIGLYQPTTKNVKNQFGQWVKEPTWTHNQDVDLPLGHGETSVVRLLRVFPLASNEVILAIRWHMSMWDVSGPGQIDYGNACNKHPLVHLIQFADQLSVTEY